ncbi:MAG TPA: hypothetical protein VEC36_06565, partial [Patescibacteria group bacterium]|nr:hypothetical protein [Patescibacteria group bacterium]
MKRLFLAILFFTGLQALAQPRISYILPDIGTPDMNTYVEIIGPGSLADRGNFGGNGLFRNPPNDPVRLECVNAADNSKITFGPLIVSWDGRMVSTQIFVNPWVRPNDWDWERLTPEFRIPIRIVVNGQPSNIDTFYIVQPFPFGDRRTLNESVLGTGSLGKRSRRGAMIVDSMVLGQREYAVSNAGVQGFLPFVLLSKGKIEGSGISGISVNGENNGGIRAGNGGPGGGGGGGAFCDVVGTSGGQFGGNGFTGGGGGGTNTPNSRREGGNGTGTNGSNATGGASLNGIPGGATPAHESAGGGTGHPFGSSGQGCSDGANCDPPGGYGGGSGYRQNQRGGGGGYGTEGQPTNSRGGKIHGNSPVVPIAGGSGGASGNPQGLAVCSGGGGGGGGAIQIFGKSLSGISLSANGGNGGSASNNRDGGSGSGGYIGAQAKLSLLNIVASANGGTGVNPGGAGRIRRDAGQIQFM